MGQSQKISLIIMKALRSSAAPLRMLLGGLQDKLSVLFRAVLAVFLCMAARVMRMMGMVCCGTVVAEPVRSGFLPVKCRVVFFLQKAQKKSPPCGNAATLTGRIFPVHRLCRNRKLIAGAISPGFDLSIVRGKPLPLHCGRV